ncbi:hypothetical protein [Coleofasciculus sp.]|uniref:hypothetical protein n=1 Tax=Coleofasciculus sp. TaxID=3100458 RepID=UPI003A302925
MLLTEAVEAVLAPVAHLVVVAVVIVLSLATPITIHAVAAMVVVVAVAVTDRRQSSYCHLTE